MTAVQERKEEPMTFEQIREMFQEIGRKMEQRQKEADQRQKEAEQRQKEIDRQMKETREAIEATDRQIEATGRQMKETDKRIGALTNRFGEVVEYMIVPSLNEKFNELGYTFGKTARNVEIADRVHGIFTEIDVLLENGDCVMIVETKTKPDTRDVDDHVKRMEKLRASADLHTDTRKYYGAIAGVVMSERVKAYTLGQGFYAIEPSGETFTITSPPGSGAPRAW